MAVTSFPDLLPNSAYINNSQFLGLSTDEKPSIGVAQNALFLELDTGDFYYCKSVSQTSEETPIDLKITKRTWVDQDITLSDWHDSVSVDTFYPSPYVVLEGNAENYAYITYPFIDLTVDDGEIQYELDDNLMNFNNGRFEASGFYVRPDDSDPSIVYFWYDKRNQWDGLNKFEGHICLFAADEDEDDGDNGEDN